jgi:drug/metabolite transporter (DMT)-like permease
MKMASKGSDNIESSGMLLLVLVCFLWGGNMVSIKVSNSGIPPILAATLRSMLASALLWGYARCKGEAVFLRKADLGFGIVLGILFGFDFMFLYWGTAFTDASRAVIFLYTTPLWVALAAHFVLPQDRLTTSKAIGLISSFLGLATVFAVRSSDLGPLYWVGDLMEVAAAMCWASTTVYVKKFIPNRPINHFQTLFAQLFFAIPILAAGSWLFERHLSLDLRPIVVTAFAYQTLVIAFFSYILWFWMIHNYQVSRLSSFTFLAPLFGVILSCVLLGEPLSLFLVLGLVMVGAGIYLVNRPPASSGAS